jgi:cytoskeletal protein CcmA (bactofilin family)
MARSWWAIVTVVSLSLATGARAEVRFGDNVTVSSTEIVQEDLYVSGGTVRIEGTVKGDLVAAAGELVIKGAVDGDVLSVAGSTTVSGPVRGSVRAMGGQVDLSAPVGEDAAIVTGQLTVEPAAQIGRDALLAGGELSLRGPVARDFYAAGGAITLAAAVGRNATLYVGELALTDEANVAGALRYTSEHESPIPPKAKVGSVTRVPVPVRPGATAFGFVLQWLRAIFAFTALGLLIGAASPRLAALAPQTLEKAPWTSLGYGALCVVLSPVAVGLLFFVGALVGGWWLGLLLAALVLAILALSFPVVAFLVAKLVLGRLSKAGVNRVLLLLAGVAALTLAIRIPFLGGLVALATILFGFGAVVLSALALRRSTSAAPSSV